MQQAQLLGSRGAFIHECGELGLPTGKNGLNKRLSKPNGDLERTKVKLLDAFDDVSPDFFEVNSYRNMINLLERFLKNRVSQ